MGNKRINIKPMSNTYVILYTNTFIRKSVRVWQWIRMFIQKNPFGDSIPSIDAISPLVVEIWLQYTGITNTLRPRQNGRHFADDILKCILSNENVYISIQNFSKFCFQASNLVQIIAWCHRGDKPLSEPMVLNLLAYICVARPHWVNTTVHTKRILLIILFAKIFIITPHKVYW